MSGTTLSYLWMKSSSGFLIFQGLMLTLPLLKKCIQFQMKQLRHTKARNDTGDHGGTFEMKHQLNIMTPSITNSGHLRRTSASSTMASNWQCRQSFILKNTRTWLQQRLRGKDANPPFKPFQGGINVTECKDKQLYGLCDCVPYISHPHTTSCKTQRAVAGARTVMKIHATPEKSSSGHNNDMSEAQDPWAPNQNKTKFKSCLHSSHEAKMSYLKTENWNRPLYQSSWEYQANPESQRFLYLDQRS